MTFPMKRDILGKHLHSKVLAICPDHAEKITGMLLECTEKDIFDLLQNYSYLKRRINISYNQVISQLLEEGDRLANGQKEEIADQVFVKVQQHVQDQAACAEITGMILELDEETLEKLVLSDELLNSALTKAQLARQSPKTENTKSLSLGVDFTKEEIGDHLHCLLTKTHPDLAAKITGMLLEMTLPQLQRLMQDECLLQHRIQEAVCALRHHTCR